MKSWWRQQTLRFRLAAWYAVGGTVLLAGFSAVLYLYVWDTMARPLNYQLNQDLAEIRQRLVIQPADKLLWDGKPAPDRGQWNPEDPWFELWDEQGRLVCRRWPFTETRVEQLPFAPARDRETISVFNVSRDLRLRVMSVPFQAPGHKAVWMIRVMTVHEPLGSSLGALRWIIAIALPGVVVLLVSGGYAVTRLWLKPLDHMVAEANRITADDLGRRLPVSNPHDELGRLASVFNVTLDRLERSFVTLDRFVADASHELRTPLTTLRSVGEVGLRRSRTVEEYREIIGSMLEEAQRLQLLVQRLLELATAEGGSPQVNLSRIPVHEYVTACVGEMSILAEYRSQHITIETQPCHVVTDPVLFRQALQNLVDNATKYSPDGATIRVAVTESDAQCHVTVSDDGPGISEESRAHITERFFRPDSARGRSKGGFGLGLSITKAYMRLLGGSLSHNPAQPTGSVFRLTLPKT